jgi:phospholipid/cholesterol/gamma-HCH transport system ATP-binding protein
VIALRHVTKRFGAPVLRDIDLTIPDGCLYGLIGPGASGKSVLLKTIAGLLRPDAGEVAIDGRDIGAMPEIELSNVRARFGMLFQNSALFDSLTVHGNVAFPLLRLFDLPAAEVRLRVEERLSAVSLPGFGDRAVAGLSGGQKKRVGIARATVTRAPIVLYDEPTAGLDPVSTQRIFDLLRYEQTQRSTTVVMVSSDVERLLTVTDRVGMLLSGRLVFDGTTEEALASTDAYVRQFVHGLLEGPL